MPGKTVRPVADDRDYTDLSGRRMVSRSARHLALIARRLRDLEAVMVAAATVPAEADHMPHRAPMQALDLTIQELAGLSEVLTGAADFLPDLPDARLEALVDLPRLQSLSRALRDATDPPPESEIVIF